MEIMSGLKPSPYPHPGWVAGMNKICVILEMTLYCVPEFDTFANMCFDIFWYIMPAGKVICNHHNSSILTHQIKTNTHDHGRLGWCYLMFIMGILRQHYHVIDIFCAVLFWHIKQKNIFFTKLEHYTCEDFSTFHHQYQTKRWTIPYHQISVLCSISTNKVKTIFLQSVNSEEDVLCCLWVWLDISQ